MKKFLITLNLFIFLSLSSVFADTTNWLMGGIGLFPMKVELLNKQGAFLSVGTIGFDISYDKYFQEKNGLGINLESGFNLNLVNSITDNSGTVGFSTLIDRNDKNATSSVDFHIGLGVVYRWIFDYGHSLRLAFKPMYEYQRVYSGSNIELKNSSKIVKGIDIDFSAHTLGLNVEAMYLFKTGKMPHGIFESLTIPVFAKSSAFEKTSDWDISFGASASIGYRIGFGF